jgi:hypothetical protein
MPGFGRTERTLLAIMSDEQPMTRRQLIEVSGLSNKAVGSALYRLCKSGTILRSDKPTYEALRLFKGRAGIKKNTRAYHFYLYTPMSHTREEIMIDGIRFVKTSKQHRPFRRQVNKAALVRDFLRMHSDQAFYSKEVYDALKENGVKKSDIMNTARRAKDKHLAYIRGYRTHDQETPFKEGYLLTWVDSSLPKEQAIEEAVERTNTRLADRAATNPLVHRVHLIRDLVIEGTKLRDLTSLEMLQNKIGCTGYELASAIERTLQLYPDILETKLFNAFRYFYHESMTKEDLHASITMKQNYIRKVKGRDNRIGHNWEAVVGWFIDKLTAGAQFWTQSHRSRMDPRRITIHLIKPVGGRRHNAEVDRVWEVTPGPLLQPTIYVLECKWGLVQKRHLDDFFDVLRWSKEFGVDTPDGRQIKQGLTGVFAGSSFDSKESVRLKDETVISLASYAARMNIQLLKAADFNQKLRDRNVHNKVTVQRVCRYARDEAQVRVILDDIWKKPQQGNECILKIVEKNKDIYDFEEMLKTI